MASWDFNSNYFMILLVMI